LQRYPCTLGLPAGHGVGRLCDVGGPLLKTVVDAGVPVLVFFAMVVVGMDLTANDFWQVTRQPGIVVAAIMGQFVLLPVIGWLLVRCLGLQPAVARGLLLVAACPSGAMANVYTYLARANVALSVILTARLARKWCCASRIRASGLMRQAGTLSQGSACPAWKSGSV
jgi:ACR3 family arsenite efflux pump ArsB